MAYRLARATGRLPAVKQQVILGSDPKMHRLLRQTAAKFAWWPARSPVAENRLPSYLTVPLSVPNSFAITAVLASS